MNAPFRNRPLPYNSPFANALVIVVGVVAIVFSLVIGVVALFALGAAVLVLAAIIGIRVWWLGFKAGPRKGQPSGERPGDAVKPNDRSVIEGEYRVIVSGNKGDEPPQA